MRRYETVFECDIEGGAGWGDWVDGRGNLYPACDDHHRGGEENELNSGIETFQAEHDISLAEEAERIGREYRRDLHQRREGEENG